MFETVMMVLFCIMLWRITPLLMVAALCLYCIAHILAGMIELIIKLGEIL